MVQKKAKHRHLYAIIRVDAFHDDQIPIHQKIAVKEIVTTELAAETEVERLNALNKEKGCYYFWQTTRLALSDEPNS